MAPPGLVCKDSSRGSCQGHNEHRAEGSQALEQLVTAADGRRHVGPERPDRADRGRLVHRSVDTHSVTALWEERGLVGVFHQRCTKSLSESRDISKKVPTPGSCRWASSVNVVYTYASSSARSARETFHMLEDRGALHM